MHNNTDIRAIRKFPWKLSFHLLSESMLPLICTILAFSAMFLLRDVIDDITDFTGSGISTSELLAYFGAKLLLNLVNIIPISMLLSTSFMVVMLSKNNEFTAIRAAGLSLARTAMPIWIAAFLLCCGVFYINEIATPLNDRVVTYVQETWLDHKTEETKDKQMTYSNTADGRDWFFREFDYNAGIYKGIKLTIYDILGKSKRKIKDISAESGNYADGCWTLNNVTICDIKYDNGEMDIPEISTVETMQLEGISDTPSQIKTHSGGITAMNLPNLIKTIRHGNDLGPAKLKEAKILVWYRLTYPLASLVGALFGFALSIAVGRGGVIKGFASSVGLLLLFFLTGQFFRVWGLNGHLPAIIAGAGSNLFFLVAGIFTLIHKR